MDILQNMSKILRAQAIFPLKSEIFYSTQDLNINARTRSRC